jgi:SAM-dependent methyltransferase
VLSRLRLRGDEVVLDAGCGTGRLTAELMETLPRGRVVGIDLSKNMLRYAREHLQEGFGAHVSLVACDLLNLPFKRVFDGIVSTAAFHWVLDHDGLFLGLRRVLIAGGWLEAQCGGGPNVARLRTRAKRLRPRRSSLASLLDFRSRGFIKTRRAWLAHCAALGSSMLKRLRKQRRLRLKTRSSTSSSCATLFCGCTFSARPVKTFATRSWPNSQSKLRRMILPSRWTTGG